jgi:hypothetical protein
MDSPGIPLQANVAGELTLPARVLKKVWLNFDVGERAFYEKVQLDFSQSAVVH